MALTENRLLKQHDISWNESPPPPINTHAYTLLALVCAFMHTNWYSILLPFLCHFPLLDCLLPHFSGSLTASMSSTDLLFKGVFLPRCTSVDTVSATPGFVFASPMTLLAVYSLPSLPVAVRYPLSLQVCLNQTLLMKRGADVCRKSNGYIYLSCGGDVPNLSICRECVVKQGKRRYRKE